MSIIIKPCINIQERTRVRTLNIVLEGFGYTDREKGRFGVHYVRADTHFLVADDKADFKGRILRVTPGKQGEFTRMDQLQFQVVYELPN